MSYVVEIRRDPEHLAHVMSAIREWLDAQRFEPDAFRCDQEGQSIVCRLESNWRARRVPAPMHFTAKWVQLVTPDIPSAAKFLLECFG